MTTTENPDTTITVNALATEYDSLYKAATAGDDADILSALASLVADDDIAEWFAKQAGVTVGNLRRTLSYTDAIGYGQLDPEQYQEAGSLRSSEADIEQPDIEELLDGAAAFGTLNECLGWLSEEDPRAYEVIARENGLGQYEEHMVSEVAAELGRSREMVRRWRLRGYSRIRERMSAPRIAASK